MGKIDPSKLEKRFITAAIIGPLCIALIYLGGMFFYALLLAAFTLSVFELWNLSKKLEPSIAYFGAGLLYLAACFYCFTVLGVYDHLLPIMLIILVASSDVGAYFFGKMIGGAKMWEAISPNKTWAGLFGACLSPMIACFLWSLVIEGVDFRPALLIWSIILGCVLGVSGQGGDLLISYFKRKAKIKDMGNLLPGHGGVLDRIDALLLSAPVFLFMTVMFY